MVIFLLIYFALDAWHDSLFEKEKRNRVFYERSKSDTLKAKYLKLAKKYASSWHALDAFIKAFVVLNIAYFCFGISWLSLSCGFFAGSLRWLWHDAIWNWINKKSFWYRGSVAKLDKLNMSDFFYFFMKIFLFALSIYLVIFFL